MASPAQHGIWFTQRASDVGSVYSMSLVVEFNGDLHADILLDSCREVIARHPALSFVCHDRDGVLWLCTGSTPPTVEYKTTGDSRPIDMLAADERQQPFDLQRGPLARFCLVRLAAGHHALVFTAHHLIFDGTSKDILVRDLADSYSRKLQHSYAGSATDAKGVPRFEPPNSDIAEVDDDARDFWHQRWLDSNDVILPSFRRPARRSYVGETVKIPIDEAMYDHLVATSERIGVTVFEVLVAAMQTLLHRYGNPSATIAIDLDTRTARTRHQIGLFVNELPVMSRLVNDGMTFADFARSVRSELREIYRYRTMPLARAVSGLTPRPVLAPVSISYRRQMSEPVFAGVDSRVHWAIFNGTARGLLHLRVVDRPTGMDACLEYKHDGASPDDARRVASHLANLVGAVVRDSGARIRDLDVMSAGEREGTYRAINATAVDYSLHSTALDHFRQRARSSPSALAVVFGGQRWSYHDLDAASDRLADRLAARDVTRGCLVGVYLNRSVELLVSVLAAWKVGAAYLPLDPSYPPERVRFVIDDARAMATITSSDLLRECEIAGEVVVVDEDSATPTSIIKRSDSSSADLAYVIYTSGSTGRPKGVEIEHRALLNLLLSMRDELRANSSMRWLAITSLSFDIAGLELLLPLLVGGCVVIASRAEARDGAKLANLARLEKITHIQATPSGWRMILDGGFDDNRVAALAGGEPLPLSLARELRPRVGRLINVYGPTETTIWSTVAEVPLRPDEITIGRPLANTQIFVLDTRMRPVPMGVPAELHIGGAGVARGYRGRPALTAERFTPNPFGDQGSRLYYTGDRVILRSDGVLEFLGRTDNQVKLRGHRIELDEIEAFLSERPRVRQAAVVVRDGILAAYVVGEADGLREECAAGLPPYMVPAVIVEIASLPLTSNGKVDRNALPAPQRTAVTASQVTVYTGIAEQVRDIWQEVLQIQDIQPDDDLFDLGGHSLTITQIIARVRKRLGVDVAMDVFFDTPTIAGVTAAIEAIQAGEKDNTLEGAS